MNFHCSIVVYIFRKTTAGTVDSKYQQLKEKVGAKEKNKAVIYNSINDAIKEFNSMKKSTHSCTMQQAFVFKMIVFFKCLFSCSLFAQTNPYQSDIVSWGSMQIIDGPVKAIAAGGSHTVALINRSTSAIEQPRIATTNKNRGNFLFGSCLFVPQNSVATLYDTQGRMFAKWNKGRYDLNQRVSAKGLFIIRVQGAKNLVFEYVKAQ